MPRQRQPGSTKVKFTLKIKASNGVEFGIDFTDTSFWGGSGTWVALPGRLSAHKGVWQYTDYGGGESILSLRTRDATWGETAGGLWDSSNLEVLVDKTSIGSLYDVPYPPKPGDQGRAAFQVRAAAAADHGFGKWEHKS